MVAVVGMGSEEAMTVVADMVGAQHDDPVFLSRLARLGLKHRSSCMLLRLKIWNLRRTVETGSSASMMQMENRSGSYRTAKGPS